MKMNNLSWLSYNNITNVPSLCSTLVVKTSQCDQQVEFSLGGGGTATEMFNHTYNIPVMSWNNEVDEVCPDLVCQSSFINKSRLSMGLTTFVDDLARKFTFMSAEQMWSLNKYIVDRLDAAANRIGVKQSEDKGVFQGSFFGPASRKNYKKLFDQDFGINGVTDARYLGPYLNYKHTFSNEKKLRIAAANTAWMAFGSLWYVKVDFQFVILIFQAVIVMTLFSGITAFYLSPRDYADFDSFIANKVRVLLRGQACLKHSTGDEATTYKARTNKSVLRSAGMPPSHIQLAVLRLKMLQRIAKNPQHHDLFLTAMFGDMDFETQGGRKLDCQKGRNKSSMGGTNV